MRHGPLAREDVPVGVPAEYLNAGQQPQQLEYLNGLRPD
jgi:hypothetical protein